MKFSLELDDLATSKSVIVFRPFHIITSPYSRLFKVGFPLDTLLKLLLLSLGHVLHGARTPFGSVFAGTGIAGFAPYSSLTPHFDYSIRGSPIIIIQGGIPGTGDPTTKRQLVLLI